MNLYGIKNRPTIGAVIKASDAKTTLNEMISLNLKCAASADVKGYMNVNLSTIHIYNGRYGKGFVRIIPCYYRGKQSTNYMTIQYWVDGEAN